MFSGWKVQIALLPDGLRGDPFVSLIADAYHARILAPEDHKHTLARDLQGGLGFSKLIPFLLSSDKGFLCLDADCIALGDLRLIFNQLGRYSFISDLNRLIPWDDAHFFGIGDSRTPIPEDRLPLLRRRFVSGIFAGRPGAIESDCLRQLVSLSRVSESPLFFGDQGILNYWAIAQRPESVQWLSQHMQVYAVPLQQKALSRSPQERLCEDLVEIEDEERFREIVLQRRLQPFVLHYAGGSKPFIGVEAGLASPLMNRFRLWSNQFLNRRQAGSTRLQMLVDDIQATRALPLKHLVRKPWNVLRIMSWF